MSEQSKGVTVNESRSMGYETVARFYSDEELIDIFGDDDGSVVPPLLRRAQAVEAELRAILSRAADIADVPPPGTPLPWEFSECKDCVGAKFALFSRREDGGWEAHGWLRFHKEDAEFVVYAVNNIHALTAERDEQAERIAELEERYATLDKCFNANVAELHKADARIGELQAEVARLRKALQRANHDCENLHHDASEYHKFDEVCPVEALIDAALTPTSEQ